MQTATSPQSGGGDCPVRVFSGFAAGLSRTDHPLPVANRRFHLSPFPLNLKYPD
jgi:hypothetical protein